MKDILHKCYWLKCKGIKTQLENAGAMRMILNLINLNPVSLPESRKMYQRSGKLHL